MENEENIYNDFINTFRRIQEIVKEFLPYLERYLNNEDFDNLTDNEFLHVNSLLTKMYDEVMNSIINNQKNGKNSDFFTFYFALKEAANAGNEDAKSFVSVIKPFFAKGLLSSLNPN